MAVVGGTWAALNVAVVVLFSGGLMLFWPGTYLGIVTAIFALIHGISVLQDRRRAVPKYVTILQIFCLFNCDIVNLALGIIELTFLNDPEVIDWRSR